MKIENLTWKPVVVSGVEFPANPPASVHREMRPDLREPVPVIRQSFGEIRGLPEPREGHAYIVTGRVFEAAGDRSDVLRVHEAYSHNGKLFCECLVGKDVERGGEN